MEIDVQNFLELFQNISKNKMGKMLLLVAKYVFFFLIKCFYNKEERKISKL